MLKVKSIIKQGIFSVLLLGFISPTFSDDQVERGIITGGAIHAAPVWFKESFLEIQDDVDEATEENKHVLLFFQLNACPYCDRMLTESFESEPLDSFIQNHFDSIAINVKGDRDIAFNADISVTEKQLSEILEVRATPAILFLNKDNQVVVRANGYRSPERFQQILNFVQGKHYREQTLADYLESNLEKNIYSLRPYPLYQNISDFSVVEGPLAIILEDSSCYDCSEFYDRLLADARVNEQIKRFTLVRLDTRSDMQLTDVDGSSITAKDIANKYQMIYRPGVLLFNQGELIRRHDSLAFSHHFAESLRYVAGGHYQSETYQDYSERRTEELLAAGININLGN